MPREAETRSPEIARAFTEHDRQATFHNFKVACVLGILLMPAGVFLDHYVYPRQQLFFLVLRLVCSSLIAFFLAVALTESGRKHYRKLGLLLAMLPTFFMSWMIYATDGATSSYYAGLNLVLLVIGFVLNWTFLESFVAVLSVLIMYMAACVLHGEFLFSGALVNNLYFLVLTGIIVVTGSHYHTKLRYREFALRFELDRNRQELAESNQKLVEMDQVKSRFFANVSHELRTPLTLLIAPLENLLNRFKTSLDDESRQLLATMHSNGMRLLKLINDLLDLVRLESGIMQVKREPVDVAQFVRGLASAVRQVADDKRLSLETSIGPDVGRVQVDRDKLEKMLLNLQFNALKFTPAGGRVEIQAEKEGEELVFRVKDTGMGIAEKNLPNVFSRFWQADDSSRRKYQGMGIGLALVKELTEVQGGQISVESREGKGTTFTIRLPYIQANPDARSQTEMLTASGGGTTPVADSGTVSNQEWLANLYRRAELFPAMTPVREAIKRVETLGNGTHPKVLIADDEPDMLRFLKSQLQRHYQVLEAVDGQQAIEKARQFLPDLILLDMMMPEKDGLQACREIRELTPTRSIPIVLITARADEETKLAALSAGASDFLPKPFSTTELHVRVKNLVESYDYQRKLAKQNQLLENTVEQLKETETQLVQSEKLASLGRLSAGIIHEINNPLNFATTGLYTLRKKGGALAPAERGEYEEILRDVEEGLSRVKSIVSDLRAFSTNGNDQRDEVNVKEVVVSALRFLSHEWRDKVRIEERIPEGQTILVNQNKLTQVVVNLLQNALDAIKGKTFLEEQPTIWIEGHFRSGHSELIIRDNGRGIDPQHLDKIFDPFFTTKEVGEGMGLGLSICYRIVQEFDGHISVKSEAGRFSEFTLDFPAKAA